MRLVIAERHFLQLQEEVILSAGNEMAAIGFTTTSDVAGDAHRCVRRLLKELWIAKPEDYVSRGSIEAVLKPEFVIRALGHAQSKKLGAVFIHSHPHQAEPEYSEVDAIAEAQLRSLFDDRAPSQTHLSLLLGTGKAAARVLGTYDAVEVYVVGSSCANITTSQMMPDNEGAARYERQLRALTTKGQHVLRSLRVAIVGLGGTGSITAQQLSYLGIRDYLLIDPDKIEETNLNRVVGSVAADVGASKVSVAARMIRAIAPDAEIQEVVDDVCNRNIAKMLTTADLIYSCTDSSGSRAVINKLVYQYFIPCIDMGSHIDVQQGNARIHGRVTFLSPGQPCLYCHGNIIDSGRVRLELMSAANRRRDPYGMQEADAQPAVISINSSVSSLAVTMMLQIFTGLSGEVRSLRYDGVDLRVKAAVAQLQPRCPDCAYGELGVGDLAPLMCREET